jgi:hypothetical protein
MITFRIKPKVRYHRHAVTRKRAELMDPWNPIGRKVAREAAIAATEISRRGKVRRQHRHGNDRGQKTQHRMGSFVESASGPHCKSTKITPAAKAAGEADRFCVNARSATSGLKLRSAFALSSAPHVFVDLRVVCGGGGNFPPQRWRPPPHSLA